MGSAGDVFKVSYTGLLFCVTFHHCPYECSPLWSPSALGLWLCRNCRVWFPVKTKKHKKLTRFQGLKLQQQVTVGSISAEVISLNPQKSQPLPAALHVHVILCFVTSATSQHDILLCHHVNTRGEQNHRACKGRKKKTNTPILQLLTAAASKPSLSQNRELLPYWKPESNRDQWRASITVKILITEQRSKVTKMFGHRYMRNQLMWSQNTQIIRFTGERASLSYHT